MGGIQVNTKTDITPVLRSLYSSVLGHGGRPHQLPNCVWILDLSIQSEILKTSVRVELWNVDLVPRAASSPACEPEEIGLACVPLGERE